MPIQTEGLEEIINALNAFAAGYQQDVIAPEVQKALADAAEEMQATCPVDTGFLRDNITVVSADETGGEIISEAPYSGFVEFGHRTRGGGGIGFVPAQPFFEPAVIKLETTFPRDLEEALSEYANSK